MDMLADLLENMMNALNKFGFLRQCMCGFYLYNCMRYDNMRHRCTRDQIDGLLVVTV